MILHTLISVIFLASCSFKKDFMENQILNGHTELYSNPDDPKSFDQKKFKRIIIAATNDLQGNLQASTIEVKDQHNKSAQLIKIGGADYISSYFKILRDKYHDVLLLDSGNILPNDYQNIPWVQDFYHSMGYDAVTLGLDDFNQRLPEKNRNFIEFIQDFTTSNKTPVLVNNLWDIKKGQPVSWPGTSPAMLKEVNGVKIGIIGIIPDDITSLTPVDSRLGVFLENMTQSTLRSARMLKSQGAEMIIVITNQSITCGEELSQKLNLPLSKVNFEPYKQDRCNLATSTGEWLKRLPPKLVDVVITGRTDLKTVNYVGNTFVLNGLSKGRGFIHAEFFFDIKTSKLNKEKTVIHQPTFFCHKFFKETNDCYTEDSSIDHHALIEARFLGQQIKPVNSTGSYQELIPESQIQKSFFRQQVQSSLNFHNRDLSFASGFYPSSKLIELKLSGQDLILILEKDFNHQSRNKRWLPNPFLIRGDKLELLVRGLLIDADKEYKILVNIKDIINHPDLKLYLTKTSTVSLNQSSWIKDRVYKDEISTTSSALNTVR